VSTYQALSELELLVPLPVLPAPGQVVLPEDVESSSSSSSPVTEVVDATAELEDSVTPPPVGLVVSKDAPPPQATRQERASRRMETSWSLLKQGLCHRSKQRNRWIATGSSHLGTGIRPVFATV